MATEMRSKDVSKVKHLAKTVATPIFKQQQTLKINIMKTYYAISADLPTDEDKVVVWIYKLCKLGEQKAKKFIWILINDNGGIGTAVEDFGSNEIEDAFIEINRVSPEARIYQCSFDEIMEKAEILTQKLSDELQKRIKDNGPIID